MSNLASPVGTTQPYIPVVPSAQLGKYAGLHMHFPVVTDAGGGTGLWEAVQIEKSNIAGSGGLWATNQPFTVATEPEFVRRVWNASAQHAREVLIRPGLSVTLAGDTNTVYALSGAPGSGTGANGDISVDYGANIIYTKLAGTWTITSNGIYPGTYDPPTSDPNNIPFLFTRSDNTMASSSTYTRTFSSGVYHFNIRSNAAGQVVAIGPWGAGSTGTVLYSGVNY